MSVVHTLTYSVRKFCGGNISDIYYNYDIDAFDRLYHSRKTANFQARMPLVWNIDISVLKKIKMNENYCASLLQRDPYLL